jgi:D-arabinose 1-dehydrogenase-like Zn-dependent alcohol dehydrogenase
MTDGYRNWTYAEYCLTPLENLSLLDERRLLGDPEQGGLGYKLDDLNFLTTLLVPCGGLKDIELQAGQTIIVAPATGSFGGAAVLVALTMGARVIAMGRNTTSLANLKKKVPMPGRLETVQVTGDIAADCEELKKFGEIDAYFDIGPPQGYASTQIKSCILALRQGARVSLMGGYREDVALPHVWIMQGGSKLSSSGPTLLFC